MAEALAQITRLGGLGMIQIRADLAAAAPQITAVTGLAVPAPNMTVTDGDQRLCWMSPDELLLVLPEKAVAGAVAALATALAGQHTLVLDVSDMRVGFAIQGAAADQVLAKLSPADLGALPLDGIRRSRAAQVACGIWRQGDGLVLIGFRSVADYLAGLLVQAARPGTGLAPR